MPSKYLRSLVLGSLFCAAVCLVGSNRTSQASSCLIGVRPTGPNESTGDPVARDLAGPEQSQQETLTNDSVIELLKVGLEEETIMEKIRQSNYKFDTSVQGMIALKKAGASDRLIHFMMDPSKTAAAKTAAAPKEAAPLPQPAVAAPPAPAPAGPGMPTEVGVYLRRDNQWVEIQPEVVNWKTGGVMKSIASAGIVKGDVNGRINGPHSRNSAKAPMEFLIVVQEGVAITEYQLIHLREKDDAREFRTVTGGVFHVSGGATRDLMQFEGTRVASRTFSVNLPSLGSGEYGFLPPGSVVSSHASATLGKMYTFRIGE